MKKFLKISNIITVCFSLLTIILFMSLYIQTKLEVGASTNILFKLKYELKFLEYIEVFYIYSTFFIFLSPFSTVIALILFCIRWFIFKEKISLMFFILIIAEIVFAFLIFFNVGNMLYDVFD